MYLKAEKQPFVHVATEENGALTHFDYFENLMFCSFVVLLRSKLDKIADLIFFQPLQTNSLY